CMERYFLTHMGWTETVLHGATAVALIWNYRLVNYVGIILFIILVGFQIIRRKKQNSMSGI
ncbi:MAG: hypothetical protein QNJ58_10890, partial [Desulfobacterales bacterium]|nr:hypothetical protein [Desulfobacterales bacterium]